MATCFKLHLSAAAPSAWRAHGVMAPSLTVVLDASTQYKYILFVFVAFFGGCGVIGFRIGARCALFYVAAYWCFLKVLLAYAGDAPTAAAILRFFALQNFLFLFCACLFGGQEPMRFLTNWSLLFHVQYFMLPRDPAFDGVARIAHAAGWFAAFAVYCGFLTCSLAGGAVPSDVLLAARERPAALAEFSAFIGWMHSAPPVAYVLDAVLSRPYLRRIYRGRALSSFLVGGLVFFAVGQLWECAHPDTLEVYFAPPIWRTRGRAFARWLGITATDDRGRIRRNALGIGEDTAWSSLVKYGGMLGAAGAARALHALALSPSFDEAS